MKNQNESLKTDAKPKMLFNSDGFEFLVKFMTVLFKIVGAVALVFVKVLFAFCETNSKKVNYDDNFVSTDITKTDGESQVDGTGYYK
ncbi:hypothetical protein A9G48_04115 [Gilliamella sp. wkB18]|uniref:hypothetical protein n=1 Tax=Gilliamella sp. wkB18 TaxID=3120260 RepID=UPI00080D9113|nr:hypothetical protein [Gilliamella apicola]OCG64116.1 hypothetical protein A9G48_04115 [Gilliamella apicola]